MIYPEFDFTLYNDHKHIPLKAVKAEHIFLIYKDQKVWTAILRKNGQWEQLLFEPLPEDQFLAIIEHLKGFE